MEERIEFNEEWYHKVDSAYFDGVKYELYESEEYGDTVPFIICSNGRIVCDTDGSLIDALRDLYDVE